VILDSQPTPVGEDVADYLIDSPPSSLPPAPLLGVVLQDSDEGLKVLKVSPQGKAEAAGVKAGDIILAVDGDPVKSFEDLKIIMPYKSAGDTIRLQIKHHVPIFPDTIKTVEVQL